MWDAASLQAVLESQGPVLGAAAPEICGVQEPAGLAVPMWVWMTAPACKKWQAYPHCMSPVLPGPGAAWIVPAFTLLGQCLAGFHFDLTIGTPQSSYSWAYLHYHYQYFLTVELKSFLLHIQQVMFCPFPREHEKQSFSFLQQNHSQSFTTGSEAI